MTFFKDVPLLPPDQIFGIVHEFEQDQRTDKTNLCIGVYRSEEGLPVVFDAVQDVELHYQEFEASKDYLAIRGDTTYCNLTAELIFGTELFEEIRERCYVNQTVGGSGALRTAAEFIHRELGKKIYLSNPSWVNHKPIFEAAGLEVGVYPYFDKESKQLDFAAMKEGISKLDGGSVVLFHASCHNPCGTDPSPEQWKELAKICKERGLFPFFDMAYHGFGDGLEEDATSVVTFLKEGLEFFIAYSYSKNMGVYGERTGALVCVLSSKEYVEPVGSVIRNLIRTNYSNCPRHGSTLVKTILSDPERRKKWKEELHKVRTRVISLREKLRSELEKSLPDHDWSFFTRQNGMFSMCGFPEDAVKRLKSEFAIYMTNSSRINIAALSEKNIQYFISSLKQVFR